MKTIEKLKQPSPLKPGDKVTVIAPSGPLKEFESFDKGIKIWKEKGYQVELGSNWNSRHRYLAGSDYSRREALAKAWCDEETKAIMCVRGGYGGARLLTDWDWKISTKDPKWLIGFSDVTSLLWSLAKEGISSLHAPVLITMATEPDWSLKRLFDIIEGKNNLPPLQGKGWGGGKANGILLAGNLSVATHLLSTPIQPSLDGVILAFEDVSEAPYRIDRYLTQWRMLGAFQQVKGIALGRFSRWDCKCNSMGWNVEDVLKDCLGDLGIPIVSDLPFGHDGENAALVVGSRVELDGDNGLLTIDT